jgi:two-component system response regulator DevR
METRSENPLRIFVVDDSAPMRERIAAMIEAMPESCLVGQAETPDTAAAGILETHPDLVVLDIHLSGGTGMDVLRKIHPLHPEIMFVVLTNHPTHQYRKAYLKAGASYLLDKSAEIATVTDIIQNFDAIVRH